MMYKQKWLDIVNKDEDSCTYVGVDNDYDLVFIRLYRFMNIYLFYPYVPRKMKIQKWDSINGGWLSVF